MIDNVNLLVRRRILLFVIVIFSALIIFRLVDLQLLNSQQFEKKSKDNSIKKSMLTSPRGVILDREFNILVSNKPSFSLNIVPNNYNSKLNSVIEKNLNLDSGYVEKILNKKSYYSRFQPQTIVRSVPFKFISLIEEQSEYFEGVSYNVDYVRDYSFGIFGSHMFGFTNEISREELRKRKEEYDLGDIIGILGLEKQYESVLRGEKGYKLVVVDSKNKPIRAYKNGEKDVTPKKGNDLVLTIDKRTQRKAEEIMKDKRGVIIAMDPNSGGIVAFVSAPFYNLSNFASVTSSEIINKLNSDVDKPLFNRATKSIHSPGSVYKMLLALALLEEGIVNGKEKIKCAGGLQYGDRFFNCTHVHGRVNLEQSIERSCNTYYYTYIQKLGLANFTKYSRMFGFGSKTGIDISEESKGNVPSINYYNKLYGKKEWTNGLLLNLSIGQGELGTTPIQLAQYISLIANYGKTFTPHFVSGYVRQFDNEFVPYTYDSVKVDIKRKNFELVRKGMWDVVNKDGTAQQIRMKNLEIAGKTGTVQNIHGDDHALFAAFAPYENPELVVIVLVENVGFGSTYAAPIAKEIFKTYLNISEPVNKEIEKLEVKNEN